MDPIRDKYIFDVEIPRSHELKYKKVLRPLCIRNQPHSLSAPIFGSDQWVHTGAKWIRATQLGSIYPYLVGTDSGAKLAPISWSQCAQ